MRPARLLGIVLRPKMPAENRFPLFGAMR